MVVTVKDAIDAGLDLEYIDREMEISQAEEWAPEDQYWVTMDSKSRRGFNKQLDWVLTEWAFEEMSKKYPDDDKLFSQMKLVEVSTDECHY